VPFYSAGIFLLMAALPRLESFPSVYQYPQQRRPKNNNHRADPGPSEERKSRILAKVRKISLMRTCFPLGSMLRLYRDGRVTAREKADGQISLDQVIKDHNREK
jgi:hypothetical protein